MSFTPQGARIWDITEAASIPAASLAMSNAIDPMLVGQYADTTARTAGTATARAAGKHPITWVDGVGWQGWDGTTWVPLTSRVAFEQELNFTFAAGARALGGWTSTTGFTGTSAGVIVTQAGVYTITIGVLNMSAVSNGVNSIQCTPGANTFRQDIPVGAVGATLSLTVALAAGQGVPMTMIVGQSSAVTFLVHMSMTRICP